MTRRIIVKGVRKKTISTDDLAYAYYLMGKQIVRERREREAADKVKRRKRAEQPEEQA